VIYQGRALGSGGRRNPEVSQLEKFLDTDLRRCDGSVIL